MCVLMLPGMSGTFNGVVCRLSATYNLDNLEEVSTVDGSLDVSALTSAIRCSASPLARFVAKPRCSGARDVKTNGGLLFRVLASPYGSAAINLEFMCSMAFVQVLHARMSSSGMEEA